MIVVVKTYRVIKHRSILKQGNVVEEKYDVNRTVWWLFHILPIVIIDKET